MTHARRAIRDLMELAPPMARVLRGGTEVELGADDVAIDEIMVVRPGERVALDGVVRAGESDIDQSPLTGESVPVHKAAGCFF
jgi:Cd2+/Zn2+-exporting ATPase